MRYFDENQIPHFFCIKKSLIVSKNNFKKIKSLSQKNSLKICN